MLNYYILVSFSYSIGIAALIGLVRFKKILKSFRPFVYIVWLAFLCEILSTVSTWLFKTSIAVVNIYVLAEALGFIWLFRNWGALQSRKWYTPFVVGFLVIVWISDSFFLHRFTEIGSLFRISYSFVLIFLAIDQINKLIVQEHRNVLRNAKFLICVGMIIFYPYKATVEVFFLINLRATTMFYKNVFLVMAFVNLFTNLIYALAALWIPTKQRFTQ
jgi:hypothetical protein